MWSQMFAPIFTFQYILNRVIEAFLGSIQCFIFSNKYLQPIFKILLWFSLYPTSLIFDDLSVFNFERSFDFWVQLLTLHHITISILNRQSYKIVFYHTIHFCVLKYLQIYDHRMGQTLRFVFSKYRLKFVKSTKCPIFPFFRLSNRH